MIRFECPGCQAIYNVQDDKAGKTGKCPSCGSQFVIPRPDPEPPASPPAVPPIPEVALVIPVPPPSIAPVKRADRPLRRVEADSDEFDDDRPRRRRRTRPQDDDQSWIQTNKGLFRVISGVMSLITGALQLMCGVGAMIGGIFFLTAFAGLSANSNNPNASNVMGGLAGIGTAMFVGCGLVAILFALFYIFAGIGALTRKGYGRILTIIVGISATLWVMMAFGNVGMSLINLHFGQVLFGMLQLLYAGVHALTSFFAAIGAGSEREFNQ